MSSTCTVIEEASATAEARRAAARLAQSADLDKSDAGRVALVATELATNIVKHAGTGMVLMRVVSEPGRSGVELLALDSGAGIGNVPAALRDGYSTAGSSGTGLGAVQRLSDVFDLYSRPGLGVAIMARVLSRKIAHTPDTRMADLMLVSGHSVPLKGESVCGDDWAEARTASRIVIMVVDGLGHGPVAAQAAGEAVGAFQLRPELPPADLLDRIHGALRSTRGAAVAIAEIDIARGIVNYCGIGNISGLIRSPEGRRQMVSHNGTVGHHMRKVHEFHYPWTRDSVLVMHSDGVNTHWDLDRYPGLLACHPALIAGVLLRDASRGRDDATVVVAHEFHAAR